MTDNVRASAGTNDGATFATDDDGTAQHPYVKLEFGADNTFTKVSAANPLPVVQTGTNTVVGSGTFAVQESQVVSEDAAAASGDKLFPIAAVRRDTAASSSGTDGDYSTVNTDASGNLWVNASGQTLTVASHAVTNAGTFAVQAAQSGTWNIGTVTTVTTVATVSAITAVGTITPGTAATSLGKAEDAAHSSGDVGVLSLAVRADAAASTSGTDGDYSALTTDANGKLWVNAGGVTLTVASHAVTNAGTFAVQAATAGDTAHDAADAGNPVKIGGRAKSSLTGITLVAADDRSDIFVDVDGVQIVKTGSPSGNSISERVSNTDGASTAFSTFGATANLRNFITQITAHNAHATTNGFVDIRDGTAGAILWTIPLPATGGATIHFNPPLRQPTANTALAFDVSAAITTVYLSVNGFQSKA